MHSVYRFRENAQLPVRKHKTDAGADLIAVEDVFIPLRDTKLVNTGIGVHIGEGYVGKVENRSGLSKKGLDVGAGVVDCGFAGEIQVVLHNISCDLEEHANEYGVWVRAGDRIAQLVIYPIDTTDFIESKFLWDSDRGSSGFGDSGK